MKHPFIDALEDITGQFEPYDGLDRRGSPRPAHLPAWKVFLLRLRRASRHSSMWTKRLPIAKQIVDVVAASSTKPTRFFLLLVALGNSLLIGLQSGVLDRPAFVMMKALMDERSWLYLFSGYSLLAAWNLFFSRHVLMSLFVNAYGMTLFLITFVSFAAAALNPAPIILADNLCVVLAAFWVLIRTPTENE